MLAVKSVRQSYAGSEETHRLMELFRRMTNDCIRIGLVNNVVSLRKLSLLCYNQLSHYDSPSYYKLCAISRAAGIIAARNKSIRRGFRVKAPYVWKPQLVSCYGFKIENGRLEIPVARGRRVAIPFTIHTLRVLSEPGVRLRSFTLTRNSLSLCISREVAVIECSSTIGVDRNLRNLTTADEQETRHYDLSETVRITRTTTRILSSLKRNDVRIRQAVTSKYGRRRHNRVSQQLHNATKTIVAMAVERREIIVLEDIRGIQRLYRKGNGQGTRYRGRMNSWSFGEAQRQIDYKARWNGLPVIRLSRRETMGTSSTCPRCGERLQEDKRLRRKLWCGHCRIVMDRDTVAAVNLSRRGRVRFTRSWPPIVREAQGGAVEAMKGNPTTMEIPGVDGGKTNSHRT